MKRYFRGDGRNIGFGGLTLGGILCAHSVLETARDTLFLTHLPASHLPWIYLTVAALTVAIISAQRYARTWMRRRMALSGLLWVGAAVTLSFYLTPRTNASLYALYVWTALLATLSVGQFWLLIADRFYVSQAKRSYSVIAAGGLIGASLGSALSAVLVKYFGPQSLLLVSATIFATAGFGPSLLSPSQPSTTKSDMPALPAHTSWRMVFASPYGRGLLLLTFLTTISLTLADLIFKSTVASRIPAAELGTFLALTYAALNTTALLVQWFLAGRLVQAFGMTSTLALLPSLVLLCITGFGATLSLVPLVLLKAFDGSLRHSLNRTSLELLFVPLDPLFRSSAKGLTDGLAARGGQAVAAVIALGLVTFGFPITATTWLVAFLSACWLLSVVSLRKHYLNLFRVQLREDVVATKGDLRDLDLASVETLVASLNSPEDSRVIDALELLKSRGKMNLVPAFILYHPSPEVVLHSLKLLSSSNRSDHWPGAMHLVSSPDPRIRSAAITAYSRAAPFLDVELLRDATGDLDFHARSSAFVALVKANGIPADEISSALEGMASGGSARKASLLAAIREQGVTGLDDLLIRLVGDGEPEVSFELARLVRSRPDPKFIPLAFKQLGERASRSEARAALLEIGDPAYDFLVKALSDEAHPSSIRRHIPRTLSRFADKAVAPTLLAQVLVETDPVVEFKILRGLGRMVTLDPDLALNHSLLYQALERKVAHASRLLAWRNSLASEGDVASQRPVRMAILLLAGAEKGAIEGIFRLLGLRFPLEDFRQIYRGMLGDDERARSGSLELVENLLKEPLRTGVLALCDRASDASRMKRLPPTFLPKETTVSEVLRAISLSGSPDLRELVTEYLRAQKPAGKAAHAS